MSPITIALIILAITVVLFIWEPIPIIVTAIGASIAFAYTGLITIDDIFTGYNSWYDGDWIVPVPRRHHRFDW